MSITRSRLEAACREVAAVVRPVLARLFGQRVGFTVFLFTYQRDGEQGSLAYISTAERAGMLDTVQEWLDRQRAGLTTDPPGPRGAA